MRRITALLLLASALLLNGQLGNAQEEGNGRKLYMTYCSGCHGTSGKGDGPAAKSLPVKPADHTRSVMSKHTDQFLVDIISKGGASVGKSSQMPAWGGVLKEPQVQDIVAYIRTLYGGKKDSNQGLAKTK